MGVFILLRLGLKKWNSLNNGDFIPSAKKKGGHFLGATLCTCCPSLSYHILICLPYTMRITGIELCLWSKKLLYAKFVYELYVFSYSREQSLIYIFFLISQELKRI